MRFVETFSRSFSRVIDFKFVCVMVLFVVFMCVLLLCWDKKI